MAAWLLKTEPSTYSFADLVRAGTAPWDGIANRAALAHLGQAAVGDTCIIYHTGKETAAVGLATIARAAYPDPADPSLRIVDVTAGRALANPVTLATLKSDPAFADSPLVRQGRLSFVPLTSAQLARIRKLGG